MLAWTRSREAEVRMLTLTAGGDERLLHVLVLLDVGLSLLEDRLAADLGRLHEPSHNRRALRRVKSLVTVRR